MSGADEPWDIASDVLLKYFWGWSPETWGTVSFATSGRRQTILAESADPFIVVVSLPANTAVQELARKVVGFYLVSHITGSRDDFSATFHHSTYPERWQFGLKAIGAFSFLPEYRIDAYDLDQSIRSRVRAVGTHGEWLGAGQIERLRQIPYVQVPIFGGAGMGWSEVVVPRRSKGPNLVKAGPPNRSGYEIAGEPVDTEKELYVLELTGNAAHYLKTEEAGLRIFKIGLSISPRNRLDTFRRMLPVGAYGWELLRSTRLDGEAAYPSFEAAEAGEWAMKSFLASADGVRWLGSEFYAATDAQISSAWSIGRQAAQNYCS